MNILYNILISGIITTLGIVTFWNMPIMNVDKIQTENDLLGTSLTTLSGTDTMSDFPTTYNANLTALNAGKIEISTTTLPLLTTLTNLSTVGTVTTGTWNADVLTVAYGGTGSTTLSSGQVLVGSSTNAIGTVAGYGTSGQLLTSAGSGLPPVWASPSVDTTIAYDWTGLHSFAATTTIATSTIASSTIDTLNVSTKLSINTSATSTLPNIEVDYLGGDATATSTFQNNARVNGDLKIDGRLLNFPYEISTNTGTSPTTVGDTNAVAVTATCSAGKKVIGGGGYLPDTANNQNLLRDSYPSADNAWTVRYAVFAAGGTGGTITAYAICY